MGIRVLFVILSWVCNGSLLLWVLQRVLFFLWVGLWGEVYCILFILGLIWISNAKRSYHFEGFLFVSFDVLLVIVNAIIFLDRGFLFVGFVIFVRI